jgi:hypothetical protein
MLVGNTFPYLIIVMTTLFILACVVHSLVYRGRYLTLTFFCAAATHAIIRERLILNMPAPDYVMKSVFVAGIPVLSVLGWIVVWYLSFAWAQQLNSQRSPKTWFVVYSAGMFGAAVAITVEPAFQGLGLITWRSGGVLPGPWPYMIAWLFQTVAFLTLYLVLFFGELWAKVIVLFFYLLYIFCDFYGLTLDQTTWYTRMTMVIATWMVPLASSAFSKYSHHARVVDLRRDAAPQDASSVTTTFRFPLLGLVTYFPFAVSLVMIMVCVVCDIKIIHKPELVFLCLPFLGLSIWSFLIRPSV